MFVSSKRCKVALRLCSVVLDLDDLDMFVPFELSVLEPELAVLVLKVADSPSIEHQLKNQTRYKSNRSRAHNVDNC